MIVLPVLAGLVGLVCLLGLVFNAMIFPEEREILDHVKASLARDFTYGKVDGVRYLSYDVREDSPGVYRVKAKVLLSPGVTIPPLRFVIWRFVKKVDGGWADDLSQRGATIPEEDYYGP